MHLRLHATTLGAALLVQGAAAGWVFPADASSHLHHHEMSRVNPGKLRAHPAMASSHPAQGLSADGSVTLTLDTTSLPADGGRVHLTIATSPTFARNESDWVALYSPADTEVTETVPVKMVQLGNLTSQAWVGSDADVTVAVDLIQMRSDFRFVFFAKNWWCIEDQYGCAWFTEDIADAVAVAKSEVVTLASYTIPVNPRVLPHIDPVLRTHEPGAWDVVWGSGLGADQDAALFWGFSPDISCEAVDARTAASPATTTTFKRKDLCGSPANGYGYRDPGFTKTAVVRGVKPGQTLFYCPAAAASGSDNGAHVYQFKAPPAPHHPPPHSGRSWGQGTPDGSARTVIAAFGDLGRGTMDDSACWQEYGHPAVYTSALLQQEADAGTIDAVYHIGDISYSVGYIASWDLYLDMIKGFSSRVPYLINQGNHEYDWYADEWKNESEAHPLTVFPGDDSGGECGVATSTYVPLPLWYSTNVGCFHIVAMNTEVNFTEGSPQWQWLEHDLKSVDKRVTPWILFGGHRPMYIDSEWSGDQLVSEMLSRSLEPLMLKYGVQLAIWGHNHAVQRLCAIRDFECVQNSAGPHHVFDRPDAPVHMVIGTGGASFTKNSYGAPYSELVFYKWGYARMSANATHLDWAWIDSATGNVLDEMHIVQDNPLHTASSDPAADGDTRKNRAALFVAMAVSFLCIVGILTTVAVRLVHNCSQASKASADSPALPKDASKPKSGWTRIVNSEEAEPAPVEVEVRILPATAEPDRAALVTASPMWEQR